MRKDTFKTKVIFRKARNGEIIALFPDTQVDINGFYLDSYMHIGQHSGASRSIVYDTKLAKPDEYADLYAELESIGYNLEVRKRFPARNAMLRRA